MKTRDAFAFREFDNRKILQRPFFKKWRERYHVGDDLSDAEILRTMHVTDSDELTCLEDKNQQLKELYDLLTNENPKSFFSLIQHHANAVDGRLEKYRRRIQMTVTNESLLQSRIKRVEKFASMYILNAARAVGFLGANVLRIWRKVDLKLQPAYRRRFGERLKSAREKAGMSRKKIADELGITPNAYGLYETGKRDVSIVLLICLARTLRVSSDWLIGLE